MNEYLARQQNKDEASTHFLLLLIPSKDMQYSLLTQINLSQKEIFKIPETCFSALPNALILNLQHNFLNFLPETLIEMKKLEYLLLDYNNLKYLPSCIGKLSNLKEISASKNKIKLIPKSIGNLSNSLTSINLSENIIENIPEELCSLSNLKELYLFHNSLQAIPSAICKLTQLDSFSLEWFRYIVPPLPIYIKGSLFHQIRNKLSKLFNKLIEYGMKECTFTAFVQYLSEEKFEVNKIMGGHNSLPKQYVGRTLLQIAIMENDSGVVDTLLELCPNLNVLDREGYSALGVALKEHKFKESSKLFNSQADVNIGAGLHGSLLHMALKGFDIESIKMLIRRGADVNKKDSNRNTPIHILFSIFDQSPLTSARIAQILINEGADPNLKNEFGVTPIHIATIGNQLEAIKWAISENIRNKEIRKPYFDLNIRTTGEKLTCLHIAFSKGYYTIIQELIAAGANTLIKNANNEVPRKYQRGLAISSKMLLKAEISQIHKKIFSKALINKEDIESTQQFSLLETKTMSTEPSSKMRNLKCKSRDERKNIYSKVFNCILPTDEIQQLKLILYKDRSTEKKQACHGKLHMFSNYRKFNEILRSKGKRIKEIRKTMKQIGSVINNGLKQDLIHWCKILGNKDLLSRKV